MKLRRAFAGLVLCGSLLAILALPSWSGDPDMPGVTEDNNYAERCFYVGDLASCLQAFWDWFMDQSLI